MTDSRRHRILVGMCSAISVAVMPGVLLSIRSILPNVTITVVMTDSAAAMVAPETITSYTGAETHAGWASLRRSGRSHVDLMSEQAVLLICPATANMIGKAAHGIADDLLSTCILAAACPKIFAPTMSAVMWRSAPVRRNVDILRADGAEVLDPVEGPATSGQGVELGSIPPVREVSIALLRALQMDNAQ
ncbi:flavoprotein [Mesorhizobium mediterraneum]|uniref:flavoprotein n=1 Tax=Mesorhizobium mediterraneum TaxID=43617 RepID=UPI001784B932|nr:flavoprotein [Mesorhizobium mediterraneum]